MYNIEHSLIDYITSALLLYTFPWGAVKNNLDIDAYKRFIEFTKQYMA